MSLVVDQKVMPAVALSRWSAVSPALLLAIAVAGALQSADAIDVLASGRFGDTDDAMRMVEVRDLLAGQAWHDLAQHRLMPPSGLAMHWSRLIDVPVAALVALFRFAADGVFAERLARIVWPALVQIAFLAGAILLSVRVAGRAAALPAALLASTCLAVSYQFVPGRIDHHDVQIALSLVFTALIIGAPARTIEAVLAGYIGAVMMAVGLESLHVVAAGGMVMVARFVWQGERARAAMTGFAMALAAATFLFFLSGVAPADWRRPVCDAIGLPVLSMALAGVAVTHVLAQASRHLASRFSRLLAALAAGALVAAALLFAFPECRAGPYGHIPNDIRAIWLDGVGEARPAFAVLTATPAAALATLGAGFAGLLSLALMVVFDRDRRDAWLTLAALAVASLAITLYQIRGAGILTALVLPASVALMLRLWQDRRVIAASVAGLAASSFVWTLAAASLLPAEPRTTSPQCLTPALYEGIANLPPTIIAAPTDLGAHLLAHTPHAVFGAPYHRNLDGIKLSHAIFTAAPDEAWRLISSAGTRYVVTCLALRDMADMARQAPQGLAAAILAGKPPAWLTTENETGPMRLYRIDPAVIPEG